MKKKLLSSIADTGIGKNIAVNPSIKLFTILAVRRAIP